MIGFLKEAASALSISATAELAAIILFGTMLLVIGGCFSGAA